MLDQLARPSALMVDILGRSIILTNWQISHLFTPNISWKKKKNLGHLSTPCDVVNAKTALLAPPCFTAAIDVNGSESIAEHTVPMKFAELILRSRQCIRSTCVEWHASTGTHVPSHHPCPFATFSSFFGYNERPITLASSTYMLLAGTFFVTHLIATCAIARLKFAHMSLNTRFKSKAPTNSPGWPFK